MSDFNLNITFICYILFSILKMSLLVLVILIQLLGKLRYI